ncbi:MAG: ClpXP protease specificity-enhancing factor SspB [Pseudomonadota bacterium]
MASSGSINYGRIMERAMRGVMADVLGIVAEEGLPANHHFYITFDTTHAGVDMPQHLMAAYPKEMMIVLQEWFDDLAVMGDRFRVTLNFSNVPETLVIPFAAVKTFIDPSVKFGLKFDDQDEDAAVLNSDHPEPTLEVVSDTTEDDDRDTEQEPEDGPDDPEGGPRGQVVSLDQFRKT